MTWFQKRCRVLAAPLAVLLALSSLTPAWAALVPTERAIEHQASETGVAANRAKVMAFMARDEVRREFETLGVDPDEATARVAALSGAEIGRIAGHIGDDPAGQGIETIIVASIFAALFVFVVLLVTDILGLTDIFPFVRPANRRNR